MLRTMRLSILKTCSFPSYETYIFFLNKCLTQAVKVNRGYAILLYCFNNYLLRPTFITRKKPFISFEL